MTQSIKPRHFNLKHVLTLFLVIVVLQTVLSYQHSTNSQALFNRSLDLFRHDSAERIADLTAISLDLLIDQGLRNPPTETNEIRNTIQEYDVVLSLQSLQQNVDEICILISSRGNIYAIDNGTELYDLYFNNVLPIDDGLDEHPVAAHHEKGRHCRRSPGSR